MEAALSQPVQAEDPVADPPRWFVPALVLVCALGFAFYHVVSATQFRSLNVYLADVGSFTSVIAGPLTGVGLQTPVAFDVPGANYFGIHFQPVLLLITPFFALANHTMTFLAALSLAGAVAAFPLGMFAWLRLRSAPLALAVAGLYLVNHFTLSLQLANHPESFFLAGAFWLFYGVESRRPGHVAGGMLLSLSVKEDIALYTLLFGASLLLERDRRRCGAAIMGASVLWAIIAVGVMVLCGHGAMKEAGATAASRFAQMGDGPLEIVLWMITHPVEIVRRAFGTPLLALYASVAFLPLLDRRAFWLPALCAMPVLVCDDPFLRELPYYYGYPALPFLFWAAVRGLGGLRGWQPRLAGPVGTWTMFGVLVAVAFASASLPTRTDNLRHLPFPVEERHRLARDMAGLIPDDAPVAVQFDLYPQVPQREGLYPMRLQFLDRVDYVWLNLRRMPADLADKPGEFQAVMGRLRGGEFREVAGAEGFVLLERVAPPPPG